MERDGLVARKVYAEVPPKVEYTLTELGRSLTTPIQAIRVWAEQNMGQLFATRERYDRTRAEGRSCSRAPRRQAGAAEGHAAAPIRTAARTASWAGGDTYRPTNAVDRARHAAATWSQAGPRRSRYLMPARATR